MPSSRKKKRPTFFRIWRFVIFFLLPVTGYLLFAYFANYYASDAMHTGAASFFRSGAIVIDTVFPYLSIGLVCTVIARRGFDGNGATFFFGLGSQLLPYLCEIAKNALVSPSVREHFGAYLESAATYTVLNFLVDAVIFTVLAFLAFLFYKKCRGNRAVLLSLITVAAVLLLLSLILNVADTVDFFDAQLHQYYNPVTASMVWSVILSYLKLILTAVVCFGLEAGQAYLLRGRKSS